jgi:23S rRNA pseudouridine1911/1915/1917 synthase
MTKPDVIVVETSDAPLNRLDKELARHLPASLGLSRSRLTALIKSGNVRCIGAGVVDDPKRAPKASAAYEITFNPPRPLELRAEAIPLDIAYEDDDLIVVNKPAGMVVHPAPGAETGTLVAALLHHCEGSLSGIGEVLRPGIVHRIDKDTSGLLVVAKSDAAHQGLAAQFADHSIKRRYIAFAAGELRVSDPRAGKLEGVEADACNLRIETIIGRHKADRKKMAVVPNGKRAVSHFTPDAWYGSVATRLSCVLETGRTHQIRVHAKYLGHALIGDRVYAGRSSSKLAKIPEAANFPRQALHAAQLGFIHPVCAKFMEFSADLPEDMARLQTVLRP